MTTPPTTTPATTAKPARKSPADLSKPIPGLDLNAKLVEPGQDWKRPERTVKRAPRPRSDQQKKLDAQALDLHTRWVKAGKPRDMDASPKAEYHVAPEHLDAMRAMLRKTANSGGPVTGKSVKIRETTMPSGKIAVTVAVWDRLEDE
jgi:hypothetical protein